MSLRSRRVTVGVLAAVDLIALLYSGDAVFLWVLFFIGILLLAGLAQAAYTLRAFTLKLELPEGRVLSGDSVSIALNIKVDTIFPPAHLAVAFETADPRVDATTVYVSPIPAKNTAAGVSFDCPFRGEYEIGVKAVEATDLFGLVRLRRSGDKLSGTTSRIAVYPRTYPLHGRMLDLRMNEGAEDGARADAEEISSIADLRSWREGDSLKRVHWKLSARLGELIVKEFDGSFDAKNMVFVDATLPAAPAQETSTKNKKRRAEEESVHHIAELEKEERMTSLAASFCELFCARGRRVRLVSYGETRGESDSADGGFSALHLSLARLKFGGDLDAAKALELECATHGAPDSLVFVTSNLSGPLIKELCALGTRGARVTVAACGEEPVGARDELTRHGVRLEMADELVGADEQSEGGDER